MSKVRIVAMTSSVSGESPEEFIAYAARVSNPANQMNNETSGKLIQYCIRNEHWSIFEMVNVVMEIETTRDIARQILRHRSFSFQEFSQRYADPTANLGFEFRQARLQDYKNRQNSINSEDIKLNDEWDGVQSEVLDVAEKAYAWAIKRNIAKEQARVVLPEGLTISRLYMNGSLRSWIHYCKLRMKPGTQREHQEIAKKCWDLILENFESLRDKT
jgi:thymidylate synthase (FAD)